jgi:hypothetical protein
MSPDGKCRMSALSISWVPTRVLSIFIIISYR